MYRIAILGTENSHAEAFAKLIRDVPELHDLQIIGVYGYDKSANDKLLASGLVPFAADSPDAFLGKADGVLITARHGEHHHEYAMPYLSAGTAAFIDKPLTVSLPHADEMINAAEKSGALICGGSSLKFLRALAPLRKKAAAEEVLAGHVCAPVSMVNDYAGFYFYSQHLIEMMFGVFGKNVLSLSAYCPDTKKNRVSVVFDYGTFDVTAAYTSSYVYAASVLTDKGYDEMHTTDLGDCYLQELNEFANMLRTGLQPMNRSELKKPLMLMHAIERSFNSNGQNVPVS